MHHIAHPDGWPDVHTVARDAGVCKTYVYDRLKDLKAKKYEGMWFIDPHEAWDLVKSLRRELCGVRKLA